MSLTNGALAAVKPGSKPYCITEVSINVQVLVFKLFPLTSSETAFSHNKYSQ
jgi:hypothetical protein